MQAFTKIEIEWIANELERAAKVNLHTAEQAETSNLERPLLKLRAEQFEAMSKKLREAVDTGSKRIEIKY